MPAKSKKAKSTKKNQKRSERSEERSEERSMDEVHSKVMIDMKTLLLQLFHNVGAELSSKQLKKCFTTAVKLKREADNEAAKERREQEKAAAKAKREQEKAEAKAAAKAKREQEKAAKKAKREQEKAAAKAAAKAKKEEEKAAKKAKREEDKKRKREENFKSSATGIMDQLQKVPVDNIGDWLASDDCIAFKKSFKTFLAKTEARRMKRRKVVIAEK